jgi:recombinational DNA repair protein (RecF pathway)
MRHKYETQGLVLARTHTGEATTYLALLTQDLGLVYARVQSLRKSGAKLAASLATLAESSLVLVHGKEGWRVTGAVLRESWFTRLPNAAARETFARVSGLLMRLVVGEEQESELFPLLHGFLEALTRIKEDQYEAAEILVVLRLLASLGLDTGEIPGTPHSFDDAELAAVEEHRMPYITRINTGIAASGL